MSSQFIQSANSRGNNTGILYFLGLLASFMVSQTVGSLPLLILLFTHGAFDFSSGNLSMDKLTNPEALGIDKNIFLAAMLFTFFTWLVSLMLFVRYVHKRPMRTLITPFAKVNWGKFFFSFGVWLLLLAILEAVSYATDPGNYTLQFNLGRFLPLLLISCTLLLAQTTCEEVVFRGYALQWLGKYSPNKLIPLLVTSLVFGLMHIANPEVGQFGYSVMIEYISIGLALGIITLLSDSLEMAMGMHFANNLFSALVVTFDSAALQTDAVFRVSELNFSTTGRMIFIGVLILYLMIMHARYRLMPIHSLWTEDPRIR